MKLFYDTEFLETGSVIHPISIGIVADDGRELYGVNAELDQDAVRGHDFVGAHVWPHLPLTPSGDLDTSHPDVYSLEDLSDIIASFVFDTPDPELWSYYAAYDHVVLAQLFGDMSLLPHYVPMWTNDIKQEAHRLSNPPLPTQTGTLHHALDDARYHRDLHSHLVEHRTRLAKHGELW